MTTKNNSLKDRLSQSSELNITVTGRKSGRPITIPIWFVLEGDMLYLLPVQGSDTQWYKNVLKTPTMSISAGTIKTEFKATPITAPSEVDSVVTKFRHKYGAPDVKKYYSKRDVAIVLEIQ